jgi:hypothetical protein
MVYEMIAEKGYTAVKVVKGGVNEVIRVDPLDAHDKAPKWRLTGQTRCDIRHHHLHRNEVYCTSITGQVSGLWVVVYALPARS